MYSLTIKRRRLGRHRLGRRIPFARDISFGGRSLWNRPNRLAGLPVEHKNIGLLGRLCERFDDLAFDRNVEENRRAGNITVPKTMMLRLIVPFTLSGLDIERDERLAEETVPQAAEASRIGGGQLDAGIDEAELRVRRHRCPNAHVANGLGLLRLESSVVAELALARNSVEDPFALAGPHVETAQIA